MAATPNTVRRLAASVCLGMFLAVPRATADAAAEVARLRAAYEGYVAQIESDFSADTDKWRKDYAREVAQAGAAAQRAGDLDGWQSATREAARFAESPTIPDEAAVDASPALLALQVRHRETVAGHGQRRAKRTNDLTTQYVARLRALQGDATRAGKLDDALAYNAELKRAQAILDTACPPAEPMAAATPSDAPVPGSPGTPATPLDATGLPTVPDASAVAPDPGARGLPDGVVIQEGGTPPSTPGTTFKPLTMAVTDRMRVARRLSVQAEHAAWTDTQRSTYVHVGSAQRIIRLGVRSATTSDSLEGATLVVQFYGKDANASGSRIVPRPIGQQKVPLPKLDGSRWVYVQLPAVATERTTYRYSYYYTNATRYGTEFYGVVVSVFDAAGALAYQAVSVPGLASLAPTMVPDDPVQ